LDDHLSLRFGPWRRLKARVEMPVRNDCRVVLIGMMGSGKTTVGALVSAKTGFQRFDNDQTLYDLLGLNARQLVEARGEDELRIAENAALAAALKRPGPSVIEAAAGTILSGEARAMLRDAFVVWLRAAPETLLARAVGGEHRPWLDVGESWIREADAERGPIYSATADLVIDTDARAPSDVADEIVREIEERGVCGPV
jgi:shikimate kinase